MQRRKFLTSAGTGLIGGSVVGLGGSAAAQSPPAAEIKWRMT